MSDFWPDGLELTDTSSPRQILYEAEVTWAERSRGALELVVQDAESQDGHRLLIVHAKHVPSHRTVSLFSIVHRPTAPYPARIQLESSDLPDFLKKSYYKPPLMTELGLAKAGLATALTTGQQVTNRWVCDTPAELRSKLNEAFNLGTVKAEIVSLVSGRASASLAADGAHADAAEGDLNDAET